MGRFPKVPQSLICRLIIVPARTDFTTRYSIINFLSFLTVTLNLTGTPLTYLPTGYTVL